MMISDAGRRSSDLSATQAVSKTTGKWLSRKIWLPKPLYNALPFFYIAAGTAAFLATIYISAWFWVLPHYLLFSAACVHLGILVCRRRHRREA